jgi:lipoprotein-releasing system ATP-binding protein
MNISVKKEGAEKIPVLEFTSVSKSYKSADAINQILSEASFTLNSGEIVALVGPSGSGKSTFLQIAGLLDRADAGEVKINGIDCTKCTDRQLTSMRLHTIGFVYQFHHLLPEFSVLENLLIPQFLQGVKRSAAIKKADAIMHRLGLDGKQSRLPNQLSGGEQQRVAFARALINDPKLLLADEPTGNLDRHNSAIVFDTMLEQVRRLGLAAIIVTHNLEIAAKCDKMMIIENNRLIRLNDNNASSN